jgi:hypothetical protein
MRLGVTIDFDRMLKELDKAKKVEFDDHSHDQEFDLDDPPNLIEHLNNNKTTKSILKNITITVPDTMPMQPDLNRSWSDSSSIHSSSSAELHAIDCQPYSDISTSPPLNSDSLHSSALRSPLPSSDEEDNIPVQSLLPISSTIEANKVKNVPALYLKI